MIRPPGIKQYIFRFTSSLAFFSSSASSMSVDSIFSKAKTKLLPTASSLNIAILSGSTRTDGPPRPILGPRVAKFIETTLLKRGHHVTLIEARNSELSLLTKPHFAYSRSQTPPKLADIAKQLSHSDAYIAITPEYNHFPCPGLLNLFNHFGSSIFSFKPSAIVTYSAGQWGGTRAANSLRPFLSELGCLPVSAMIHIPMAQNVIDDDGHIKIAEDVKSWEGYVTRCISQLEWWGEAAKRQKEVLDPSIASPVFIRDPTQRNAPV